MMDRLREGVNSIAVKIILGLIILSFVLAGVSNYLFTGSNNGAADVGGTKISRSEFEQAYQNERNRMQAQLGDYFSNLLADSSYVASFRRSVLDRMVNDLLLQQHAQSLGLAVSDAQVRQAILDTAEFQSDGKFNQDIYKNALRRAGFTPDSFAAYLRTDLVRSQLMAAVQTSDFSLPGEVVAQSKLIAQTRNVKTITLKQDEFAKAASLSDEEIKTYYDQNSDRFTRPEQFKISYIELDAKALEAQMEVTDADAQKFYQEHLDKYSSAEQRDVSHILVQDDEQKAQDLLAKIRAGGDFAELAKEQSQDSGSAAEGGELGLIEKGTMDPAFEKAAFDLTEIGTVSEVVKSNFGYHIIKLNAIKAASAKPFETVRNDVIAQIKSEKALDRFYALQTDLEKVAFESPDSLDESAKAISAEVKRTDFISQADAPNLLQSPAVVQALNSDEVKHDGLNSQVLEVAPEHVIVVRVDETRKAMVLPLDEVKDQVKSQLANVKGAAKANELAGELVSALKSGDQSVLAANNVAFGELETVGRNSPLANAIFSMKKPLDGTPVFGQTQDANGDVVIVELLSVEANIKPELSKQVGAQLERLDRQQDVAGILSILRGNTDIKYYLATE
jgi:peptidyl-prolyl cis-trans isomerase D